SDTGQNRVFIWNALPSTLHQEPDIVLGQKNTTASGRNRGGSVSAESLHYPSGIWSDGHRLVVADAWNHRVLIWHQMPIGNGQAADVVLGQPDFEHSDVNVKGISHDPTSQSLHWPYGVFSDGTHLWIADTGNRRILFYETIPQRNYALADKVIGKPNFTTRDFENDQPIWPYSLKISKNGVLAVADTQFYRTLLWHNWEDAFKTKADVIIGQPNFDAAGQNQFGLFPDAHTMNWTYDVCFYKEGLLVNDTGNSRLLFHETIPSSNNKKADAVIGKRDFTTGSENKDTMVGTDSSLYWPFSICVEGEKLIVADTGNHRLVMADVQL
ncbi:MAG: hypothetical protein AAGA86_02430, partial [Bacteroidota bacterium]